MGRKDPQFAPANLKTVNQLNLQYKIYMLGGVDYRTEKLDEQRAISVSFIGN
jgi:hypothetical protein